MCLCFLRQLLHRLRVYNADVYFLNADDYWTLDDEPDDHGALRVGWLCFTWGPDRLSSGLGSFMLLGSISNSATWNCLNCPSPTHPNQKGSKSGTHRWWDLMKNVEMYFFVSMFSTSWLVNREMLAGYCVGYILNLCAVMYSLDISVFRRLNNPTRECVLNLNVIKATLQYASWIWD